MTQLPALAETSVPVPIAPDLDLALADVASAIDWGTGLVPADRAPSPALRDRLEARAADLARWLVPCRLDAPDKPGQARVMVAALLAVLPVQGSKGSTEDAEKIQGLYLRVLGGLPAFALRAACATALTHGIGGNRKFAPSPADLRAEAEREAAEVRAQAVKLARVLAAKIEPPRPSAETRRASAEAARRAFRIPPGGFATSAPHAVEADAPGSLARVADDIRAKSQAAFEQARAAQRADAAGEPPPDRFGEDAA